MEQKIASFQNKGMIRDLSISKVNNEFAYENFNVRIIARDHDTLLSVTNERGNKEIHFDNGFSTGEVLIGYSVLNSYIVLFTHEDGADKPDHIYRIEYISDDNWDKIELFNGDLKFDTQHPIETLANYETESVQKVYWVDGINQPRFINIMKLDYSSDNPTQFDFVTEFSSDLEIQIDKVFLGTALFGSGTIQYYFTYSNDFGQETNIVGKSFIYNLSDKENAVSADSTSSCAFEINLRNLDSRFDNINIYSLVVSSTITCNKVATLPISAEVTYIDTGAYSIPIDPTTLLYIGGTEIHAETLAQKDNKLFIGNIELQTDSLNEDLKTLIDATIKKDSEGKLTGESSIVEFVYPETGDYVFENNSLGSIYYEDQQLNLSSDKFLFFKGGEKYRFGLVFLSNTGRRSSVYWIGDKVNTLYPKAGPIRTYKAIAKCTLPPEILSFIIEHTPYRRAVLVRAIMSESDRSVIAQGFVSPTVFNVTQRVLNSPYAMSSWFFRPKNSDNITNTHFSQIPGNKSTLAELQNVKGSDTEDIKPPYFSIEDIETSDIPVWVRWTIFTNYKDNCATYFGVVGAVAKVKFEFFSSDGSSDVNNDTGLIPDTTIIVEGKWRETWPLSGFDLVWQEFSRSYTLDLIPTLWDRYSKYARYVPQEPTEEMKEVLRADWLSTENFWGHACERRTTGPLQRGKVQIGGILTNNGLIYGQSLGNRFYIDESLITLHSPDIEFGTYNSLSDDFKFRIIGYSPLTAGTTNFYMDPDNDNDMSSFLPYNLSKENITSYPEQPPTLPFFSGNAVYLTKNKQGEWVEETKVSPYIIYPWHKTGPLYKVGDTEEYILKNKILANLKYSLYTNYCWLNKYKGGLDPNKTDDYNYYMRMSWEPKYGIESVDIADELTDNIFVNIDGEKLYYNNYDFVLSTSSDEKYPVYTTGDIGYTSSLESITDTVNWTNIEKPEEVEEGEEEEEGGSTSPVNLSAKSKKNCVISFKGVGDEMIILPSVNGQTDYLELTDYYLPWKEYIDDFQMDDVLIMNTIPYYTPDNLIKSGTIYIIDLNNTSDNDAFESFSRDFRNAIKSYPNTPAICFVEEVSGDLVYHLGEGIQYWKNVAPGFDIIVTPVTEEEVVTGYTVSVTPGSETGTYNLFYVDSGGAEVKSVEIAESVTVTKEDADTYSFRVKATYSPLFAGYSPSRENQSSAFTLSTTTTLSVPDINTGVSIKTDTNLKAGLGEIVYLKNYLGVAYSYSRTSMTLNEVTLNRIVVSPDSMFIPLDTYGDDGKIDTDSFDTSAIFVGELYRDIQDYSTSDFRYGGIEEDALKKNIFVDCGVITDVTQTNTLYGVEGDSYYQRYDVLKTIPYAEDKENNIIEIFSGMVESRINLNGKTDRNMFTTDYTLINTETFNSINELYTRQDSFITSAVMDSSNTNTLYPTQFTWTKTKTLGEQVDVWTNLTLASVESLDGDKGPLRAIRRFQNSLIAFQDKGIAEILFNSRTQLGTQEGVPIELANSGTVDGKRYITDKAGCINKWSIVETKNGIYFIDNINSSISLFTGTVKSLSDEKGFKDWIGRNNSTDLWNPVDFSNFVAYWDRINDDVYFLRGNEEKHQDVLCYNEMLGQFTSFFNYGEVPMMVNVQDKFVAFREDNQGVNKLWIQGEGEFNNMFGSLQDYHMLYRITPDPYGDKTFSTLEYRADMFDMSDPNYNPYMPDEGKLTEDTFDTLEVWNEYQGNKISVGDSTSPLHPFKTKDKYPDVRRKFRIWRMDIPRDKKGPDNPYGLNRIRNPWIYLKLSKTPTLSNERMEFHDLAVRYFE